MARSFQTFPVQDDPRKASSWVRGAQTDGGHVVAQLGVRHVLSKCLQNVQQEGPAKAPELRELSHLKKKIIQVTFYPFSMTHKQNNNKKRHIKPTRHPPFTIFQPYLIRTKNQTWDTSFIIFLSHSPSESDGQWGSARISSCLSPGSGRLPRESGSRSQRSRSSPGFACRTPEREQQLIITWQHKEWMILTQERQNSSPGFVYGMPGKEEQLIITWEHKKKIIMITRQRQWTFKLFLMIDKWRF